MVCKPYQPCNIMPADIVANGIIVLSYECGTRYENRQCEELHEEPLYMNIVEEKPMSWRQYIDTR